MSVLLEFAMFPTDKGISVSKYVSKIVAMIRESGYPYQLTPMGTIVETGTVEEVLEVIRQSHNILEPDSDRIYSTIKLDIKKNASGMMNQKMKSVESKIGSVNR